MKKLSKVLDLLFKTITDEELEFMINRCQSELNLRNQIARDVKEYKVKNVTAKFI